MPAVPMAVYLHCSIALQALSRSHQWSSSCGSCVGNTIMPKQLSKMHHRDPPKTMLTLSELLLTAQCWTLVSFGPMNSKRRTTSLLIL